MSPERTHRLWRLENLQVPRKRPRRRVATSRPRPLSPSGANQIWAYDFVFDACANGQKLKCLTVVDEWTRECQAKALIESWRTHYNHVRPHSSLGYKTPAEFSREEQGRNSSTLGAAVPT